MIHKAGNPLPPSTATVNGWAETSVDDGVNRPNTEYVLQYRFGSWLGPLLPGAIVTNIAEYSELGNISVHVEGVDYDDENYKLRVWVKTNDVIYQQAGMSPLAIGAVILGILAFLGVAAVTSEYVWYRVKTAAIVGSGGTVTVNEQGKDTSDGPFAGLGKAFSSLTWILALGVIALLVVELKFKK